MTAAIMNSPQRGRNFCVITLDEDDLSFIVNGKKDNPIDLRPIEFKFTKEHIWKAWCNIGFIPMNSKCLENFKVRQ